MTGSLVGEVVDLQRSGLSELTIFSKLKASVLQKCDSLILVGRIYRYILEVGSISYRLLECIILALEYSAMTV